MSFSNGNEARGTPGTLDEALLALKSEREKRLQTEANLRALEERFSRLRSRSERDTHHVAEVEHVFHELLRLLPIAFVIEDADARIVWAHPSYLDLFQLKVAPEKLVDTDMRALERNACHLFVEPQLYLDRLEAIRAKNTSTSGDVLELSSGDIWIRDCHPIQLAKAGVGWIHVIRDVTSERSRDARLEKSETEARDAERNAIKFLASISHQFKTPLSAIVGLIELTSDTPDESEREHLIQRLQLNAELLGHLVDDVSAFSELDDGRLKISESPMSPQTVLAQVVDQMRHLAEDKGLTLKGISDPSLPTTALGDPMRTRQLLVSLVGNAIRFTSRGDVAVRAFRTPDRPDEVTYEVHDTGIGISDTERHHVFDRYYRGNSDSPGAGLGLALCRDLVHAMKGRIGLESEEGRGTCVFFTLPQPPLNNASPSNLDYHIPWSRMSSPPHYPGKAKVLLVEDDPVNRKLLDRMLESAGYVVSAVEKADDALLALQQGSFDVLLTDISMPGMDGIQLVEALRAWERDSSHPPTPAMVVTAHVTSEYQERCRDAGVDVFLGKPINGTALRRALAKISMSPPKVLLVDDALDARILLEVCLKQYPSPLAVHVANSGETAIAACRENQFSIVFIDALMPKMGGIETAGAIREIASYQRVPLVAVTALEQPEQLEALKVGGFDDVVSKPIDRHKIFRVVRDCLRFSVVVQRRPTEQRLIESAATLLQLESVSHEPSP